MCFAGLQATMIEPKFNLLGFGGSEAAPSQERMFFPLQALRFGRLNPATGAREVAQGQYGLVPDWVDAKRGGAKYGRNCYNARTESVFEKPSFRKAILSRRAVVPVEAFYEFPDKEVPLKHRYKISAKDKSAFWLAGIWEWNPGLGLMSVAVLTTGPMDLLAPFHSRSPLLLDDGKIEAWLDPKLKDPAEIAKAFVPHSSQHLLAEQEDWGKPSRQGELF